MRRLNHYIKTYVNTLFVSIFYKLTMNYQITSKMVENDDLVRNNG